MTAPDVTKGFDGTVWLVYGKGYAPPGQLLATYPPAPGRMLPDDVCDISADGRTRLLKLGHWAVVYRCFSERAFEFLLDKYADFIIDCVYIGEIPKHRPLLPPTKLSARDGIPPPLTLRQQG